MFFNWKKWLYLFFYRREKRREWLLVCRGYRWRFGGRAGVGVGGYFGFLGVISFDVYFYISYVDF